MKHNQVRIFIHANIQYLLRVSLLWSFHSSRDCGATTRDCWNNFTLLVLYHFRQQAAREHLSPQGACIWRARRISALLKLWTNKAVWNSFSSEQASYLFRSVARSSNLVSYSVWDWSSTRPVYWNYFGVHLFLSESRSEPWRRPTPSSCLERLTGRRFTLRNGSHWIPVDWWAYHAPGPSTFMH